MTDEELTIAYRMTFSTPHAQAVLTDLAKFCRATETCVMPGQRDLTYVLEGRREAFLRILEFSKLSLSEIYELRLGRSVGRLKHGDEE